MFGKTGYIASSSSKKMLKQNIYILSEIDLGLNINNCNYSIPSTFMGTSNPRFVCITEASFHDYSAGEAVKKAAMLLQDAGWKGSTDNFKYDPRKIQFFKDDLSILIEPYYWQQGATENSYKFLVIFSHMILWKPTWAM
jgi:hypothetical protein